jgi:hypothetical protein
MLHLSMAPNLVHQHQEKGFPAAQVKCANLKQLNLLKASELLFLRPL